MLCPRVHVKYGSSTLRHSHARAKAVQLSQHAWNQITVLTEMQRMLNVLTEMQRMLIAEAGLPIVGTFPT